jgi:hypothetical protein
MGGGLMQLVAYGAQDIYLTGNPQITFFKVVYRRHTNFSMEAIEQTFNGAADFGRKVTCNISRNGDLIHRMYLQATLPSVVVPNGDEDSFRWVDWVGHALIKNVELEIGGQRIDKHYGDWLHIWNELSQTTGHQVGYGDMVGNTIDLITAGKNKTFPEKTLYIPLEFWFCRNPGLALPLIALQYHEVKVNLEFREKADLCKVAGDVTVSSVPQLKAASLYVDYVYLDTDERRRFAQVSHEYLIEQLQFTGDENITSTNNKIKLNFNHPVKELIWVVQPEANVTAKDWFDYTVSGANPVATAKLQLNGHDRFAERDGRYFNLVQPYQHHENVPATGINVYSFGLKPEEHQPSGTCNMSRIDTATLHLNCTGVSSSDPAKVRIYSVSYNVLRIMSGMGGLAYSN